MNSLVTAFGTLLWLAGIVLAKGAWSVGFAIVIPVWSWYLVVEEVMRRFM